MPVSSSLTGDMSSSTKGNNSAITTMRTTTSRRRRKPLVSSSSDNNNNTEEKDHQSLNSSSTKNENFTFDSQDDYSLTNTNSIQTSSSRNSKHSKFSNKENIHITNALSSNNNSDHDKTRNSAIEYHYHHQSFLQDLEFIQQQQHMNDNESSNIRTDIQSVIPTTELIHKSIVEYPTLFFHHHAVTTTTAAIKDITAKQRNNIKEKQQQRIMNNLIKIAKTCIRSVVLFYKQYNISSPSCIRSDEQEDDPRQDIILESFTKLRIAIHCIRSILPIIMNLYYHHDEECSTRNSKNNNSDSGDKDKDIYDLIMLLYHIMKCIEDIVHYHYDHHSQGNNIGSTDKRQQELKKDILTNAMMITISGYQLLYHLLLLYGRNKIFHNDNKLSDDSCHKNNSKHYGFPMKGLNVDDETIIKVTIHTLLTTSEILWKVQLFNIQVCIQKEENNQMIIPLLLTYIHKYGHDVCELAETLLLYPTEEGLNYDCKYISKNDNLSFRLMLSCHAVPWIVKFLSKNKTDGNQNDQDCVDTCISFLSRARQILLDSAKKLESIATEEIVTNYAVHDSFMKQSLLLRQDSIMVSLLYELECFEWVSNISTLESRWNDIGVMNRFEKACVSSSNYSFMFVEQMKRKQQSYSAVANLISFHDIVGNGLDLIAKYCQNISVPYIEYCSHRVIHLGEYNHAFKSKPIRDHADYCIFSKFCFPYFHPKFSCCQKQGPSGCFTFESLLSLIYAAIATKQLIYSCSSKEVNEIQKVDTAIVKSIIVTFRKSILSSDNSIGKQILLSCYRMLSNTQVLPFATQVANNRSNENNHNDETAVYLLGNILGECYSPLSYILFKQFESEDSGQKYYYFAVESYLRAAGILDTAAFCSSTKSGKENNFVKECFLTADRYISKCGVLLCKMKCNEKHLKYLESATKCIQSMGKRRYDEKFVEFALLHSTVSIDLSTKILQVNPNANIQKVSFRYNQLSTILQSLDMKKEACFALCNSLKHLVSESKKSYDVSFSDILLFSDEYISGKVRRSLTNCSQVSLLTHKITRLYISILITDSSSTKAPKIDEDFKYLRLSEVGDSMTKVAEWNSKACLASIIREMLGPSLHYKFLVNELLVVLCSIASKTVDQNSVIRKDLEESLELLSTEFSSWSIENLSAFYLTRANAMNQLSNYMNPCENATTVLEHVEEALRGITSRLNETSIIEQKVLLLAFNASLLYLKVRLILDTQPKQMLIHYQYQNVLQLCSCALNTISNKINTTKVSKNVGKAIMWTAAKVILEYRSCNESALCIDCRNLLYNFTHKGIQDFSGFEGFVLPALRSGEMNEHYKTLINLIQSLDKNGSKGPVHDRVFNLCNSNDSSVLIANIFADSIQLESLKESLTNDELGELSKRSKEFEETMLALDFESEESKMEHSGLSLFLVLHWWLSCCQYALADGYNKIGEVERAICFARKCIDFCKKAMKFTPKFMSSPPSVPELKENGFALMFINLTSLRSLFLAKRFDCYAFLAKMYCYVGEHRKAKSFVIASSQSLCLIPQSAEISNNDNMNDILTILGPNIKSVRHLVLRNTVIYILAKIKPGPKDNTLIQSVFNDAMASSHFNLDWLRETIKTFILMDKHLQFQWNTDIWHTVFSMINELCELDLFHVKKTNKSLQCDFVFNENVRLDIYKSQCPSKWTSFRDTKSGICLMIARHVIAGSGYQRGAMYPIINILDQIAHLDMVSKDHRAEAFYLIGHHYLEQARENGELQAIWECHSPSLSQSYGGDESTPHLDKCRSFFQSAASLSFPPSNLLCRNALRCLALTIGPVLLSEFGSAGEILHTSIGSKMRQIISRLDSCSSEDVNIDSIFRAYDINLSDKNARTEGLERMYEEARRVVPPKWNFVAMALCPTGELLISSLHFDDDQISDCNFNYRTICIFPSCSNKFYEKCEFMNMVLKPFDNLMDRSKNHLNDVDKDKFELYNSSRDAKLKWWSERGDLDNCLNELLNNTQELYFAMDCVKEILIHSNSYSSDSSFCGGNLAARFEAACTMDDVATPQCSESKESLQKLTVKQLKERLEGFHVKGKDVRSLRKAELIDLLQEKLETSPEKVKDMLLNDSFSNRAQLDELSTDSQQCTFLILDEHLCRFPFEGLPLLRHRTVCRIPSIPFAISGLSSYQFEDHGQRVVNPALTKFILDPESNLPGTQKRLNETLTGITESYDYQWESVVGRIPSEQFMKSALLQENGMFLYFGHNGGERCFSQAQIESLMKSQTDESHRQCKASIILMGCSSGVVLSVNQCNGHDMCNNELYFEPEGVALSYLCAGAPCVVSNLWDVTDTDIDRYSTALLERLYVKASESDRATNIAQAVASTRDVCKMKNIVGCAPVIYGIPVSIIKPS